jgi:SNF2 family DNA or RNA helicase
VPHALAPTPLQAEDRAHRIGQMRDVCVYKLVAAGTVDEDIHTMGERKRELTEGILAAKQGIEKEERGGKNKGEDKDDDINTIGKILQGALQRRTNK